MQSVAPKTSRGVQEADVWAAADALLADGQRPTIERVRLHMGRGSPNTVGPMLDAWYTTLGSRLGLNQAQQDLRNSVPSNVLEAAQVIWSTALTTAQTAATEQLAAQQAALDAATQALQTEKGDLARREEALLQQKLAMDNALALAHAQREDLARRLDEMQQQLHDRDAAVERLRLEGTQLRQQRETDRFAHTQALDNAAQERQRLAEQFAGNERRMLNELDRSRAETEKIKKQWQDSERKAQLRWDELQTRHQTTEEELLSVRAAHINTQHALELAQERVAELKALLAKPTPVRATDEVQGDGQPIDKPRNARSLQSRALAQRALRWPRK